MNRHPIIGRRIPTKFGSIYTHMAFDDAGPVEVTISTPGKHSDTAVEAAMYELADGITACLKEWRGNDE